MVPIVKFDFRNMKPMEINRNHRTSSGFKSSGFAPCVELFMTNTLIATSSFSAKIY